MQRLRRPSRCWSLNHPSVVDARGRQAFGKFLNRPPQLPGYGLVRDAGSISNLLKCQWPNLGEPFLGLWVFVPLAALMALVGREGRAVRMRCLRQPTVYSTSDGPYPISNMRHAPLIRHNTATIPNIREGQTPSAPWA